MSKFRIKLTRGLDTLEKSKGTWVDWMCKEAAAMEEIGQGVWKGAVKAGVVLHVNDDTYQER